MIQRLLTSLFSKKITVTYPLAEGDAASGEFLISSVPAEQRRRIGPFYSDLSPNSHYGPYRHAIDFLVKDGSLVYAARAGTVVEVVESHDTYGPGPDYAQYLNFVTINHGTWYSQYAHLQKGSPTSYGIHVGKKVVTGQVIGIVGKSGWVDYGEQGDHLHFMLFKTVGDSFMSLPVAFTSHRT